MNPPQLAKEYSRPRHTRPLTQHVHHHPPSPLVEEPPTRVTFLKTFCTCLRRLTNSWFRVPPVHTALSPNQDRWHPPTHGPTSLTPGADPLQKNSSTPRNVANSANLAGIAPPFPHCTTKTTASLRCGFDVPGRFSAPSVHSGCWCTWAERHALSRLHQ